LMTSFRMVKPSSCFSSPLPAPEGTMEPGRRRFKTKIKTLLD
jgi:hypothetical protein